MVRGYGPRSPMAKIVLLLTTTGRKSGLSRTTPLQYEQVDGAYYVSSARGAQADWYRNLQANPQAEVQVGEKLFTTRAELITDPARVAGFLELRIRNHPRFMKLMLRLEGLPPRFSRADLEKLASRLAVVKLSEDGK